MIKVVRRRQQSDDGSYRPSFEWPRGASKQRDKRKVFKNPKINVSLPVVKVDQRHEILWCNREFGDLFGLKKSVLIGSKLDKIIAKSAGKLNWISHTELDSGLRLVHGYAGPKRKYGPHLELEFLKIPLVTKKGMEGLSYVFCNDITQLKSTEEVIKTQILRNQHILDAAIDGFCIVDMQGKIVEANQAMALMYGLSQKDLVGMNILDFKTEELPEGMTHRDRARIRGSDRFETKHRRRNAEILHLQVSINFVEMGEKSFFFSFFHDISDLKRSILMLTQREMELEVKSKELEDVNSALKVLLEIREKDRIELEERVFFNIKRLLLPSLERLRKCSPDKRLMELVDILEANVNEIISSFSRSTSSSHLGLTHSELQVANLIRHGKSTKEIAEMLNVSGETVNSHRGAIRKKLGIIGKKLNLRDYLLSIQ